MIIAIIYTCKCIICHTMYIYLRESYSFILHIYNLYTLNIILSIPSKHKLTIYIPYWINTREVVIKDDI